MTTCGGQPPQKTYIDSSITSPLAPLSPTGPRPPPLLDELPTSLSPLAGSISLQATSEEWFFCTMSSTTLAHDGRGVSALVYAFAFQYDVARIVQMQ